MPPKKSATTRQPGELESRLVVRDETLVAGALQSFNPQIYTTPFVRNNAKLFPADLGVPAAPKSVSAQTSGICMSLPQANDMAVPLVLHSHRQLDVTGPTVTLTSADLKRTDENTVLSNIILQTSRRIQKIQLLFGTGAAAKIVSTVYWPIGQELNIGAEPAYPPILNYSLMGCLASIQLNPADIDMAIRVFFVALEQNESFDSEPAMSLTHKTHNSSATLLFVHQLMIGQFSELRSAFMNPDKHKAIAEEFATMEARQKDNKDSGFVNALNRGLGFKVTTQEPAELHISATNPDGSIAQVSHNIPSTMANRVFTAVWVWVDGVSVQEAAEKNKVESMTCLGSSFHHSIARDPRKNRGPDGSQHYFLSFTPGSLNLSDSSHSGLVFAKPNDQICINFAEKAGIMELGRVHAYIIWYDLYSLQNNKAVCLTTKPPAILTLPKASDVSRSSAKEKKAVETVETVEELTSKLTITEVDAVADA